MQAGDWPKKDFDGSLYLDECFVAGSMCAGVWHFSQATAGVFALECCSRLSWWSNFFSEGSQRIRLKLFTVVLQVAAHAIFAIGILHLHPEVVTVLVGEGFGNFFVAIEAFEGRRTRPKDMAGFALRCAAERRMRFG